MTDVVEAGHRSQSRTAERFVLRDRNAKALFSGWIYLTLSLAGTAFWRWINGVSTASLWMLSSLGAALLLPLVAHETHWITVDQSTVTMGSWVGWRRSFSTHRLVSLKPTRLNYGAVYTLRWDGFGSTAWLPYHEDLWPDLVAALGEAKPDMVIETSEWNSP